MAEQQAPLPHLGDKPRSKTVRSHRIVPTSTTPDFTQGPSRKHDVQPPLPLTREQINATLPHSHTPSLAKTLDKKKSLQAARQRAQSMNKPSSMAANTSAPARPPATTASGDVARVADVESPASSSPTTTTSLDASTLRPAMLRSTSAIAAGPKPAPATGRGSTTTRRSARGLHTSYPPLPDATSAPDVPPAPASGMYWSKAPVSGSPHTNLRAHTTTLVGNNVYVFGGCDARTCFNQLYVFDADAFYWSAPHVVGDLPVPLRAMTCTAVGKKLVIFGGGDGPAYYNDVYVLDTVSLRWTKGRILGNAPSPRRAHTACFYRNGIYVFGGGDGVRALNDVWRLDVSDMTKMTWKLVSPPSSATPTSTSASPKPKPRGYHTANMVGSKLIVYGGSDGGECFQDVWIFDVDTNIWRHVDMQTSFPRLSHTATIVGSYLFVIGGHDGVEYSNDVLLLNLVTMQWDKRRIYGQAPTGRGYHGTVLYDSRLLLLGGFDGTTVFGEVWVLELAVHAYYSQISHFKIDV